MASTAGILLVHGAWHGPWCWDRLAERLAGQGHPVRAVQLRGHDQPPGRIWHRVHHYAQDVGETAARFVEPPVLVGHSLGGLIVQKYLEHGPAQAAVLLAPLPHRGTLPAIARLTFRHPTAMLAATLSLRLRPFVATPALVRELFFTPDTPRHWSTTPSQGSRTSPGRLWSTPRWCGPGPGRVQVPVLVLGAEHDGFFTAGEMDRTAAAYHTQAEILAGMGHDLMLDPGWPQVADRIHTWTHQTAPAPSIAELDKLSISDIATVARLGDERLLSVLAWSYSRRHDQAKQATSLRAGTPG